ncbi:MAG: CoB--CoM heterodisulfide reductase iron-sulfur subunit B family protein [Eggerthellaceae bacterium]|jgi:heterodisulfide reductase subunit B
MNRTYAYFPGCSADTTGISYTMSMEYVNQAIGLNFREIPDWNCCGASAAAVENRDLGYALPARSLALAEMLPETPDVVAPCASCYNNLKRTSVAAREDDELRQHLSDLIGMPFQATNNVVSLLELLSQPDIVELIKQHASKSLKGLRLACYYGCTLVRPAGVCEFDDVENPQSMDRLMAAVGAEPVDWGFKTECCGASNQVIVADETRPLINRIYRNAQACGAEAIVTACPLCWLNLDMREDEINRKFGTDYDMPVFYFTQILALALGASPQQAGIDKHFKDATDFVIEVMNRKVEPKMTDKERRIAEAKAKAAARKKAQAEQAEADKKAAHGAHAAPASEDATQAAAEPAAETADREGGRA